MRPEITYSKEDFDLCCKDIFGVFDVKKKQRPKDICFSAARNMLSSNLRAL